MTKPASTPTPLTRSESIWDNTTLAALGVTPGDYTWTWRPAPDQTFTIDAIAPISEIPLPAALPLSPLASVASAYLGGAGSDVLKRLAEQTKDNDTWKAAVAAALHRSDSA